MTVESNKLSYTSRTFDSIVDELRAFVRETRPDLLSDFFDSNTGMVLIDIAGLVGEMLAVGQDITAQEMFLATCKRYESGLREARSVGYTPRSAVAATVLVKSVVFPDALVLNGGTIPALQTKLKGQNGLTYELLEDVTIAPGDTIARLYLSEGVTYEEEFVPAAEKNQEVFTSNSIVAQDSWELFVGDPNNPVNKWTQVDNVQFETGATNTYDIYYDGLGRTHFRFGDGSSGAIPASTITVKYRTTNGSKGNSPVSSIRGSIQVNLSSPGSGTVSVTFENKDEDLSTTGGTQQWPGESLGTTVANVTQSGAFANVPLQSGSAFVTITLPGIGGTVTLQDDGAGSFTVVTNTTGLTLVASSLAYTSGSWSMTFSSAMPSGGTISADYFSVTSGDPFASSIIGAAQGGEDRETLEDLKRNIPAYLRSQDKIITVDDYNVVLLRLAGIALVFADLWLSSYTANAVKVHVWADEVIDFRSETSDGTASGSAIEYSRYAQVQQDRVNLVQAFLKSRTLLTVHNVVLRPTMMWVDLYLGDISYDQSVDATEVRDAITAAVVKVFQDGTGFVVHLSEIYNAVRDATGVRSFNLERVAVGTQQTGAELQGSTLPSSPTFSGTLLKTTVTPRSVTITINQTSSSSIVLRDNGAGQLVLESGVATVVSSSIDYLTGAWTVTFSADLVPNQDVVASYSDVARDHRRDQVVYLDLNDDPDQWPPPGTPTSNPITPPYKDGRPATASRPAALPFAVTGITRTFGSGLVTATATTALNHNLSVGQQVRLIGATPTAYNGDVTILTTPALNVFTYQFAAGSDPGAVTGSVIGQVLTVVAPYQANDRLEYEKLIDIRVQAVAALAHYYDDTYLYNNEIYYDSVEELTTTILAINLRRLVFNLTPS